MTPGKPVAKQWYEYLNWKHGMTIVALCFLLIVLFAMSGWDENGGETIRGSGYSKEAVAVAPPPTASSPIGSNLSTALGPLATANYLSSVITWLVPLTIMLAVILGMFNRSRW